jgi:hypothetical protein
MRLIFGPARLNETMLVCSEEATGPWARKRPLARTVYYPTLPARRANRRWPFLRLRRLCPSDGVLQRDLLAIRCIT